MKLLLVLILTFLAIFYSSQALPLTIQKPENANVVPGFIEDVKGIVECVREQVQSSTKNAITTMNQIISELESSNVPDTIVQGVRDDVNQLRELIKNLSNITSIIKMLTSAVASIQSQLNALIPLIKSDGQIAVDKLNQLIQQDLKNIVGDVVKCFKPVSSVGGSILG